ncbi:MAG: RHS repeat-associated core domain-containing protein, partial [Campylobacteraceae bacterium]|nr:RHS repeat-associated core domain-containing protein [Campylobacteraceae bacterium]
MNNLIQRYYYYPNSRVPYKLKDSSNNIYYLSYNHQQSLRAITDINGNVVKDIEYSVYGEILNDTNSSISVPFSFAGGVIDSDTKLIRFGYRYYDTYSSKWTSKDPIDFNGKDINLYNYVLNDPVNLIDPIGLSPLKWFGKAKGANQVKEGAEECEKAFDKKEQCDKLAKLAEDKSLPYYEQKRYRDAYWDCYYGQIKGPNG